MIVRSPRADGTFQVIANGELLAALRQRHPEIHAVPTLICSGLTQHDKVLLAGSALLGLSALFRHRENQVEAMVSTWLAMQRANVNPLAASFTTTLERACRLNQRTLAAAVLAVSKRQPQSSATSDAPNVRSTMRSAA